MSLNHHDFEYIRHLVYEHTALVLALDKSYLVESRLTPLIQKMDIRSIAHLIKTLRNQPFSSLHQQVLEAMVTTETLFFRDHHPFEALRHHILPDLIHRRRIESQLTIWSAACSSGQEPYSLAILLQEHFPELAGWTLTLLASDVSGEMLARAEQGIYSQHEVQRGIPRPLLQKYFQAQGPYWKIHTDIRRMIEFRQLNLAGPWPPLPNIDIVLMRNVLIYFDVITKKSILAQLKQVLRGDGYLLLGGGETTLNLDQAFEPVQVEKAVCYCLRTRSN